MIKLIDFTNCKLSSRNLEYDLNNYLNNIELYKEKNIYIKSNIHF